MLFAFLCFVFHGAAPIPYVQMAILNLTHPYLRSTTILLDTIALIVKYRYEFSLGGWFICSFNCGGKCRSTVVSKAEM